MRLEFVTEELQPGSQEEKLLLIFAGWAMDANPFRGLHKDGYSIAVAFDYREARFSEVDSRRLGRYHEICVVAWSWGVPFASQWIAENTQLPITAAIAVAGTPTPVDGRTGIPLEIFLGTLDGLCERSLRKFYRRICPDSDSFARFAATMPQRPIDELRDELETIATYEPAAQALFDHMLVPETDAIIPPENQRRAWDGMAADFGRAHLPDFGKIIGRYVRDKQLVGRSFAQSGLTYHSCASPQRAICHAVGRLLPELAPGSHPDVVEIGAGSGIFTKIWQEKIDAGNALVVDLNSAAPHILGADGELLMRQLPSCSADIVASTSTMQWFNSPGRFLHHALRVLRPGGSLLVSSFLPGHFAEIEPYLPNPLPYHSEASLRRFLAQGKVEKALQCEMTMIFTKPQALLRHIGLTGVSGLDGSAPERTRAVRGILRNGVRSLTYRPLILRVTKL